MIKLDNNTIKTFFYNVVKIGKIYKGNTLVYPTLTPMPVVLVNKTTLNKVVTNNLSEYPASEYEPIGVVVIPAEHNVYGTGEAGVMALKNGSLTTPDEGTIKDEMMFYGGYKSNTEPKVLTNYTRFNIIGGLSTFYDTIQLNNEGYSGGNLASQSGNIINPYDTKTRYGEGFNNYIPSPYLNDGSRNPDYYTKELTEFNILSDFSGKESSAILWGKSTNYTWRTDETIWEGPYEKNYPAACCCWRFHTLGTEQGDWYLPAMGELGYLAARDVDIDNTISTLVKIFNISICKISSNTYFSITEKDIPMINTLYSFNIMGRAWRAQLNDKSKAVVRPFTRIKIN